MRAFMIAASLAAVLLVGCGGGGGGGSATPTSSSSASSVSSSSSSLSSSSSSSVPALSYRVNVVDDAVVGATVEATECTGSAHLGGSEYNLSGCVSLPTVIKAEGGFVDINGNGVQDANETSMGLPLLLNARRFGITGGYYVTPLTTLISNAADAEEANKTARALGISYADLFGGGQPLLQQKINAVFVTAAENGINDQLALVQSLRTRLIEKDGNFTYAVSKLETDLADSVSSVLLVGFVYDAGQAVEAPDPLEALREYNVPDDSVVLVGFIYDGIIADANITVTDGDSVIGRAVSDARGRWSITLQASVLAKDTVLLFEGTGTVSGRKVLLKAAVSTTVLRDLAKNRITASDAIDLIISNVTSAEVAIIGKSDGDALKDPVKLQKAKEEVKTVKQELLVKVAAAIKAVVDLDASDLNGTDSFTFVDAMINDDGTDINTSAIAQSKLDQAEQQNGDDKILSEQLGSVTPGETVTVTLPFEGFSYEREYGWSGTTQFMYYQRTHVHLAQTAVPAVYNEYNSGGGWSTTVPGTGVVDLKLNPTTGTYLAPQDILETASIPTAADTVLITDVLGLGMGTYIKVLDEVDISNQTLQLAELDGLDVTFSAGAKVYSVSYRALSDDYWIGWSLGQTDLVSMVNAHSGGVAVECEEDLCYGFESNISELTAASTGNMVGFFSWESFYQTVIGTWRAEKLPGQSVLSIKVDITHPDYQVFNDHDKPLMTMYNGMAMGGRYSPSMVEFAPVEPIYNTIAAADIDQRIDEMTGGSGSSSSSSAGTANDSPLVGAWTLSEPGVPMGVLLVNLDNEHYFNTQQALGMGGLIGGVEVGFMTLETDGNMSNYQPIVNTNQGDTAEGANMHEVNATAIASKDGTVFNGLIATTAHPETGAWIVNYERYDDNNSVSQVRFDLLVLDGAGTYMVANVDTGTGNELTAEDGRNNMTEFGAYTVTVNGDLSVDLVYTPAGETDLNVVCTDQDGSGCGAIAGDSNGQYGFSDSGGSVTAHIDSVPAASENQLTATVTGTDGTETITMQRIVPNGPFNAGAEPW